jgi:hypothetical protein
MEKETGPRVWTTRSPNTSVGADAEADCPIAQVRSSVRCSEGKRCSQKQGEPLAEELMRQRRCGDCERLFYVCPSCDRGHRYCSERCQAQHRTKSLRAARQRHQLSPEGRLDHRDRQRTYRARQQQRRVTDHTSVRNPSRSNFCSRDAPISAPTDGAQAGARTQENHGTTASSDCPPNRPIPTCSRWRAQPKC